MTVPPTRASGPARALSTRAATPWSRSDRVSSAAELGEIVTVPTLGASTDKVREIVPGLWTTADCDPHRITPVHSLGVHLFEVGEGRPDTREVCVGKGGDRPPGPRESRA